MTEAEKAERLRYWGEVVAGRVIPPRPQPSPRALARVSEVERRWGPKFTPADRTRILFNEHLGEDHRDEVVIIFDTSAGPVVLCRG